MRSIVRRSALTIAALTLPAMLAVGCSDTNRPTPAPTNVARATTVTTAPAAAVAATLHVGDDNHDGKINMRDRSVQIARPCVRKSYKGQRLMRVPATLLRTCFELSARKERTIHNADGSSYTDPAGAVTVMECRLGSADVIELTYCIRQP